MKNGQTPKKLIALDVISLLLILLSFLNVFLRTPVEVNMGLVQKVFYFHVAYAWIGMLSFLVAAVSSILYLKNQKTIFDSAAESAVEIGLVFTLIAIITGSIWAKPIWNTWWTWDPRLTTTSIMALIYVGYIFLRHSLENPDKKRKITAVFCIVGCLSVPLTFFSIRGARSIHPVVIAGENTGMNLTPLMVQALIFAILSFSVFYIALLWHRVRLSSLNEEVERMKNQLEEEIDV